MDAWGEEHYGRTEPYGVQCEYTSRHRPTTFSWNPTGSRQEFRRQWRIYMYSVRLMSPAPLAPAGGAHLSDVAPERCEVGKSTCPWSRPDRAPYLKVLVSVRLHHDTLIARCKSTTLCSVDPMTLSTTTPLLTMTCCIDLPYHAMPFVLRADQNASIPSARSTQ